MNIRVLGFSWAPKSIPAAISAAAVFSKMESGAGGDLDNKYYYAATKVEEYWAGILIKIRNARAFTKKRMENGTLTFGAETLEEGESLAEGNFFVAHQSNGHGLYCHHHTSASLLGDFGYVTGRLFSQLLKEKRQEVTDSYRDNPAKLKQELAGLKGNLFIEQVIKPGAFNAYVRNLKEIHSLEANLVSFEMKKRVFSPLVRFARRKKMILSFDPHGHMGEIAAAIADANSQNQFATAKVVGKDANGALQTYKLLNDKQVFDQWDYDQMITDTTIRFNDIKNSIKNAPITKKLIETISQRNIRTMLNIT